MSVLQDGEADAALATLNRTMIADGETDRPAGWRVGNAEIDLRSARLNVNGVAAELDHSGFEVLVWLVRHAGKVVDKNELLRVGWPGRVVTDNSLRKSIVRLRSLLGDPEGERLQSVRGYGYRFMGEVEPLVESPRTERVKLPPEPDVDGPAIANGLAADRAAFVADPIPPAAQPRSTSRHLLFYGVAVALILAAAFFAARRSGILPHFSHVPTQAKALNSSIAPSSTSIAVLPFVDQSPQHDEGYFADGLADELLDHLSRVPQLRVVARTSSFAFRGKDLDVPSIGKQLHAAAVLEGSVAKSEGRLRVVVQLIDASDGFHLWSKTYERPMAELFAMENDIAGEILGALRIELSPPQLRELQRHATDNAEAYQEYLLAQYVFQDDETAHRRSIAHMEHAVELDPNFVDAWFRLADWLSFSGLYADDADEAVAGKRRAMEIAERIIALTPTRPEGYFLRGTRRYSLWGDWSGAERDIEHAHALGPADDAYFVDMGRLRAAQGRLQEALVLENRALLAEPLSGNARMVMGYHYTALKDFAHAREVLFEQLRAVPTDEHTHYYLGLGELLQGHAAESLPYFEDSAHELRLTGLAIAHHSLGDAAASERDLQVLISRYGHILPYQTAEVYAWRGENDQAFEWLARARELHDASYFMYLRFDPLLASIRSDQRFAALLAEFGSPQQNIAGTQPARLVAPNSHANR